jgi:hypothetical protein
VPSNKRDAPKEGLGGGEGSRDGGSDTITEVWTLSILSTGAFDAGVIPESSDVDEGLSASKFMPAQAETLGIDEVEDEL